jgi:hypothetical protein
MIAKYDGFCALCANGFEAGTEVTKDSVDGYVHADCWRARLPEEPERKQYHATAAYVPPARHRTRRGHRGVMS